MIRFPKPDFESGYVLPETQTVAARAAGWETLDVVLLALALAVGTWLVLKHRRRGGIVALMLACLAYFGFYREGCVCPVGSIQNVAQALGDSGYGVPLVVLLFFLLPLLTALFFGRTFCAGICPLGAIQDIVIVKPVRLPAWLRHALGVIPTLYLGVALLLAYAGAGYLVCRYDPFVGLFRLSATLPMLIFGGGLLLLGTVVARPYCRFLCPYGVLLGWASACSWKRVTVTPNDCVQCRLCETACPFDAIRVPSPERESEARWSRVRRMGLYLVLLPALALAGGWTGARLMRELAAVDPRVELVAELDAEALGVKAESGSRSEAFRASGMSEAAARAEADEVKLRLHRAGLGFGGFIGLAVGLQLAGLSIGRRRVDYEPDRQHCLACGRCFAYCPREQQRRKQGSTTEDTEDTKGTRRLLCNMKRAVGTREGRS
ncbi:MAG: 4Fe-4S binding protein [Verrucomicrobia bacterium]|nr:4Fe-4S binding protein [Verrucomicrobiota bacterium]MBT7701838.1 4Fe-4S binding protein [Verrucomicrobiota bacterium]